MGSAAGFSCGFCAMYSNHLFRPENSLCKPIPLRSRLQLVETRRPGEFNLGGKSSPRAHCTRQSAGWTSRRRLDGPQSMAALKELRSRQSAQVRRSRHGVVALVEQQRRAFAQRETNQIDRPWDFGSRTEYPRSFGDCFGRLPCICRGHTSRSRQLGGQEPRYSATGTPSFAETKRDRWLRTGSSSRRSSRVWKKPLTMSLRPIWRGIPRASK